MNQLKPRLNGNNLISFLSYVLSLIFGSSFSRNSNRFLFLFSNFLFKENIMSEVSKIQAIQRSLAIAQRTTSSALTEARKHRSASPSLAGGKRRRRSGSPKKTTKRTTRKRSGSRKGKK